jgi:hypothetical protein
MIPHGLRHGSSRRLIVGTGLGTSCRAGGPACEVEPLTGIEGGGAVLVREGEARLADTDGLTNHCGGCHP